MDSIDIKSAWKYYYNNGQFELAIEEMSKVIALNSNEATANDNRGMTCKAMNKYDLAIQEYSKAIQLDTNYADAYYNRGLTYYYQNKYDLALQDYSKAIELNPNYATAYNNRGLTYYYQNKYDLALQDYSKAIELNPNDATAYNYRGLAYYYQNQYDLALQDYFKAIQLEPNYVNSYFNKGNIYFIQNKYQLALQDFTRVIELDPNDATAYNNRGLTYYYQDKYNLALQDYFKAIQLEPNYADTYRQRGIVYKAQNKYDLALQDFTKGIELNPNDATAYNNRGLTYYYQDKYDLALQDYFKAIELNPIYATAYNNRGLTYYYQNKYDLALQDYSKAIELNPNDATAYYNRGLTYYYQDKYDLALQDYFKAIQLDPNDATAYHCRGIVYKVQYKYDLANLDYSKAIELNPSFAEAYFNRGLIYDHQEKCDLALYDYLMSTYLKPDHPLFLAYLGALLHSEKQNSLAYYYLHKAQNTLNSFDEVALKTKFESLNKNMQFVKQKIQLLHQIDGKFQLKQQITFAPQQEKLNQQTQTEVESAVFCDSKNNQQNEINNLQRTNQSLINELRSLNQVEKYHHNFIDKKLEEYKQPQNKHKLIYYTTFYGRLKGYFLACSLLKFDLIYKVYEKLETTTGKEVNLINLMLEDPVASQVFEISLGIIDYGINCHKEKKFEEKINNVTAVIESKAGVTSYLQREIQIASFKIIDKITENDLKFSNFKFQEIVSQVLKVEESNNFFEDVNNPYHKLGIDHSLRALKFIEQYSQKILTENTEFRDIILKSIEFQDSEGQSKNRVQIVENRGSRCCNCEIF